MPIWFNTKSKSKVLDIEIYRLYLWKFCLLTISFSLIGTSMSLILLLFWSLAFCCWNLIWNLIFPLIFHGPSLLSMHDFFCVYIFPNNICFTINDLLLKVFVYFIINVNEFHSVTNFSRTGNVLIFITFFLLQTFFIVNKHSRTKLLIWLFYLLNSVFILAEGQNLGLFYLLFMEKEKQNAPIFL